MGGSGNSKLFVSNGSHAKVTISIASTKPRSKIKSAMVAYGDLKVGEKEISEIHTRDAVIEPGNTYEFALSEDYLQGNILFTFELENGKTKEVHDQVTNKKHMIITLNQQIVYARNSKNVWICENGTDHKSIFKESRTKYAEFQSKKEEIKKNYEQNRRNVSFVKNKRQKEIEKEYDEEKEKSKQASKRQIELLQAQYKQFGIEDEITDFTQTINAGAGLPQSNQSNPVSTTNERKEKIKKGIDLFGHVVDELL